MAYINNVTDTLFADVSEFQSPVTDAYPQAGYQWLSIRSNDGTHQDQNFAANYQWCVEACNDGRLKGFIVYYYWRPGGTGVTTHINMVNAAGGPHPQMVSMIDVESGSGNTTDDVSDQLNSEYAQLGKWLGDQNRVIGYANTGDYYAQWGSPPPGLKIIAAGYGANPRLPNQIAHQYTDGNGYGGGLPEGAPPWPKCDMNSADGLSVTTLANLLGVGSTSVPAPPATPPVTVTNPPVVGGWILPTDDSIYSLCPALVGQFVGG